MQVDYHFTNASWDEALASVARLDERYRDPYLDFTGTRILLMAGRHDAGRVALEGVVKEDSSLEDAWWELIGLSLARGDHAETARLLGETESKAGVDIGHVFTMPEYAELVASSAHAAWQAQRSARR